jgi:Secretion system C-terminal sorting domain
LLPWISQNDTKIRTRKKENMIRNHVNRYATTLILSALSFAANAQTETGSENDEFDSSYYALRVVLVQFEGYATENEIVIEWSTILETNLTSYEVQRSTNNKDFVTIGKVIPKGSQSIAVSYSFSDVKPVNGKNTYRLKMVDTKDRSQYTATKVVNWGKNSIELNVFRTYPNPANRGSQVNIELNEQGSFNVGLFNIEGKRIFSMNMSTSHGSALNFSIPANVNDGVYILKVNNQQNNNTHLSKIVVR